VGLTPRRNPELVVAVLWQNGNKSWFAARIGAKLVSAYVEKQRRLAKNLTQPAKSDKPDAPVEMTGVWTDPDQPSSNSQSPSAESDRVQSGSFLVDKGGQIVARTAATPAASAPAARLRAPSFRLSSGERVGNQNPQPARKPETAMIAKGQ
jgi:hypothetical protein